MPNLELIKNKLDNYIVSSNLITGHDLSQEENYLRVRIYYNNYLTVSEKNQIYYDLYGKFKEFGYNFYGVTEYIENNEMCFKYKLADSSAH